MVRSMKSGVCTPETVNDQAQPCRHIRPLNEVWGMNPRDSPDFGSMPFSTLFAQRSLGHEPQRQKDLAKRTGHEFAAQRSLGHEPQRQMPIPFQPAKR